ncbi:MAG: hypothetical protein QMD80_00520 [archaeon]|nr:hypothetical protein [archaeon]
MKNAKCKNQTKAVAIVLMSLLALSTAVISVNAHMPGAKAPPAFELSPIVVLDDGTEVEITIEDVAEYHASQVTGTGPGMEVETKGEYKIILLNGTEVTNMSNKNLKIISKDNTLDNFRFDVCRNSTGECFEVVLKEGVFPEDFFELRKKVKFDPENATSEERALFKSEWEDTRDKFLTLPDWELFEGVEEPEEEEEPAVVGGAIFFSILVIGLILFLGLVYSGKKAR